MSSSLELLSLRRGSVRFSRWRKQADVGTERDELAPDGLAPARLWRYLPLVALTTMSVVILPAALVVAVVPRGGTLLMAASAVSAVAVSVAIASAEAALWKRQPRSRDFVFADLMLWGWLSRCWTERRLAHARDLYDSARKAGPAVSIELLERLSKLLEARDAYTHGHSQRVARHAECIARAMHIAPVEIAKIRAAAMVHDVGKLYIPREILNNPARLTDVELAVIKRHPGDGADMLAAVGDPEIAAMVRHHHERMDGNGYPDGLVGSEIPLGARIIAVADTFDAITSSRCYRSAGTHKKAMDILSNEAGSQLDGTAVAAFLSRYSARRSVAWFAFATAAPQRIIAGLQTASPSLGANTGGVASILPALGTASLLALSPGLRHDTLLDRGVYRQPDTFTQPHQLAIPAAAPTTGSPRRATMRTASTRPSSPDYNPSHATAHISPGMPASKNSTAGAPTTPASSTGASGTGSAKREPVAAAPPAPPTTSSPAPTSPPTTTSSPPPPAPPTTSAPAPPAPPTTNSPPPTPPTPPGNETPTLPAPPISLPVTVPGASVNLPPVHLHVPPVSISTLATQTHAVLDRILG
jgi:HD-GYP domain-containing protein (c-di-GMP phosphodiesterase class II)